MADVRNACHGFPFSLHLHSSAGMDQAYYWPIGTPSPTLWIRCTCVMEVK